MKAAVVTSFEAPLEITEREIPEPGPGQVLVRIEACGLCHTDIHAAHGDWPVKPTPPFVPGHEGVGHVVTLGAGVTNRSVGDRVAIPWLGHACGHCDHCVAGWETLCEEQQNSGYSVDGGFAEYAVADATYVVPVPDAVSSFDAAPLTCAGVTTYKAVKVAHVQPSERVAVFGIGGLGHLAIQYARLVGAEVIAVDITDEKLALATELGADHVINAALDRPGPGDRRARRRRCGDRAGGVPPVVRAGVRVAASRWTARLCRPAARGRGSDAPADLRDRPQGHPGDRLDRRHPPGPRRGLPVARARSDPGRRRGPEARGRERGHRRGPRGTHQRSAGLRVLTAAQLL